MQYAAAAQMHVLLKIEPTLTLHKERLYKPNLEIRNSHLYHRLGTVVALAKYRLLL